MSNSQELSAELISFLRIIHLAPGLEHRRYPVDKSVINRLGDLTNRNLYAPKLTEKGLRYLEAKDLRVFGRKQNDIHELHLRDRLAELKLLERTK